MTNKDLVKSYLFKAEKRLKALKVLYDEQDYSDVVREAQEIVELCLKALLRAVGVEPPKYHDVSNLLKEHRNKFPQIKDNELEEICFISKRLRKERELSFYGDIDFIPTEEYTEEEANTAIQWAEFVYNTCKRVIGN
ncbi:HEPN domain-containing protein [Thermodesulfovibrio hydrogeniphilus]